MHGISDWLGLGAAGLSSYSYSVVFGCLFFESFGFPLPGESLLIAAVALSSGRETTAIYLALVAFAAAVLGDNLGYLVGASAGRRIVIRFGSRLGLTKERFDTVERFFDRHGGSIVIVARFFDVLRQLNGIVAGCVAMNWYRFLAYNLIGAAMWVAFWTAAAYYFKQQVINIVSVGGVTSWLVVAGVAAVCISMFAFAFYRHRAARK